MITGVIETFAICRL